MGLRIVSTLIFQLQKEGKAVVGQELAFTTQYEPPRGIKLAKKNEDGVFETLEGEGKSRGVYNATSSVEGKFSVPICSGVALGTVLVSAEFTDADGNLIKAQSPVVSIRGGLANYANFSLTFDPINAKTLKGFFNTNSDHVVSVRVKTNTSSDGEAIVDHPVTIAAETGR